MPPLCYLFERHPWLLFLLAVVSKGKVNAGICLDSHHVNTAISIDRFSLLESDGLVVKLSVTTQFLS